MKINRVTVEGCGRFGTPARIEGFGPGVNILSARNEAGKSTLFRAIRTCLFERHSATNKDIQALATEGLSLPVSITVAFEKAGKNYEIRKSFLKSKSASLLCEGIERARNAEADEEVWKLLGIEHTSARAVDAAAYGILWVEQGRSFQPPEPSEGAKSVLNAVIQQEVGTLVGGERARILRNALEEELGRYLTDSGRQKTGGPLDTAARDRARLTGERLEAETRLAALNDKLAELERLRADHKRASDAAAMQILAEQLKNTQGRLSAAEKAGEELRRLEGEERHAHERAEAQQGKLDALHARAAAIDEQRKRLKALAAEIMPLDTEEETAGKALQEATAERTRLDEESQALEARNAELQRLEGLATRLARRAGLENRLTQLQAFRSRAAQNEAALKAATIDEAATQALESIERDEARIRAAMEAGAARVAIEIKPGANVTMNGAAVSGNIIRAATEPLTIAIGEDVAVTVSPPAGQFDTPGKTLAALREKLSSLLARHGVSTAGELRQRRADRIALEDVDRDIRAERAALGIKDNLSGEVEQLQAAIGEIAAEAQLLRPEDNGELPAPAAFEAEKRGIAERRGTLHNNRAACEAQIVALSERLRKLASTRGALRGQSEAIHSQIESAIAVLPDEKREEMIRECTAELGKRRDSHRITAAALSEKQSLAPAAEETERLKSRADRLANAIREKTDEATRLREAIARLEGEVLNAGGEGLGEHAATLKLQLEMASAEEQRLLERVEVLRLLRDTVDKCYAERRDQLNAPLLRNLKPFLNDVFPEAEIALGEDFSISGLSRSQPESELFGRLSLGTQEQVAVLVRLAMGAMITERGSDVPVILDDALVFSDDDRIEQMFDAINRAGRRQQVIVLTCRSRSFASLGGRQLKIV